jgi:hypothetical protein
VIWGGEGDGVLCSLGFAQIWVDLMKCLCDVHKVFLGGRILDKSEKNDGHCRESPETIRLLQDSYITVMDGQKVLEFREETLASVV